MKTWAVCSSKQRLAVLFWKGTTETLTNSLIASALASGISQHENLTQIKFKESRDKFARHAVKFDSIATDLLDECFNNDGAKTGDFLLANTSRFPETNLLKVG